MTDSSHYQPLSLPPGVVTSISLPLVTIEGLTQVKSGEILLLDKDAIGQVLSFTDKVTQCMLLSTEPILVGSKAWQTGKQLSITVGVDMLGFAYNPLGHRLTASSRHGSQHTPEKNPEERLIDVTPPPLPQRNRIDRQLNTGTMLVDSILPIGHGQRELVAGDPKTGKTAFLLSAARTQAKQGTVIIYALIGKRSADIQKVIHFFTKHRMLEKTIIVASTPSDSPSVITLTPFTAMTIAEYFRDQNQDTLVILDDLSSHARFYREVALLEKRFPGRDSYPGDIFYTHARLLERAGCFKQRGVPVVPTAVATTITTHPSEPTPTLPPKNEQNTNLPTVAITCLPVAETTNGDLTDFVVSNLISITDGHLLFDARRFAEGKLPAIDMTLSVTRVGKQTQTPLGRSLTQKITSFLNNYYKARQLTHFGSELSNESREKLEKGGVIESLLTQTTEQIFTLPVQHLSLGLAWLGWLRHVSLTEDDDYRNTLSHIFKQETLKAAFNQMIDSSGSLDELLDNILQHEHELVQFFEHEHTVKVQKEQKAELEKAEEAKEALVKP